MKKWKKSGKLCQMKDGSYEIEKLPHSKNVEEVRMALEKRKEDYGREGRITERGEEVAQEAMDEEKQKREKKHTPKSTCLSKKKGKKSKGKPKMGRWPKNKAERRKNQEVLWGGLEGLKGFEMKRMKTSSGEMHTYYVKTDPNGRMRIADVGEDAPAGYYALSSRYYALKRNARPAKRYTSLQQRAAWYDFLERMKLDGGFLDKLGNRGLIRKIDGKCAEMNFGGSAAGRKFIDSIEAYSPNFTFKEGRMVWKGSKYIMIIEQGKIKPESWAACHQ
jgi:hypothetical protein